MATYENYFDFYTRGPYAHFVCETRSAGTEPVRIIHAKQPEGDFSDPAHKDLHLVQVLSAQAPVTRDFSAGHLRIKHRHGDFELQAPNAATTVIAEGDQEIRGFILPFSRVRSALGDTRSGFDGDFGRLHAVPFRDFFLDQLCARLWVECEAGSPNGDLFADTALAMIAAMLSGLADRGGRSFDVAIVGKDQIVEFIEASLDRSVGLPELAALSDLPEAQFLGAFRSTFGTTPHQYVLSRRIARAQELLAVGQMPLAEIAYACGFASQSHMTDVFREKLGVTPGRYRKEVRS